MSFVKRLADLSRGSRGIGIRVKECFFDRAKVINAMDRVTHWALKAFGKEVRSTAQKSMQRAEGPSAPGTPPHVHGKALIKKQLYYSFDFNQRSVVIGPEYLDRARTYAGVTIPQLMEEGGTVIGIDGKVHIYPARPYMGPAFEAAKAHLNDFWQDAMIKTAGV